MHTAPPISVAIIVAHPIDETLWVGGTLLCNPQWEIFVCCLCRGDDQARAPLFRKALHNLGAQGAIGELDDSPNQEPLPEELISETIVNLLPKREFDLVFTHSPEGEYTRNVRHEEIGKAVIGLWNDQRFATTELRLFAYEDGNRQYRPRAIIRNTLHCHLSNPTWKKKLEIITDKYEFGRSSWEAQATPKIEAFYCFQTSEEAMDFFNLRVEVEALPEKKNVSLEHYESALPPSPVLSVHK